MKAARPVLRGPGRSNALGLPDRRLRRRRVPRARVRVGAPDESLTRFSGLAAVTELVERLRVIDRLDGAVGPIKTRDRGFTAGQVLVGMAAAQLCGQDFLVGLDRHRADTAGQVLTPVVGLASTTAAGLARRFTGGQWVVQWRPGSVTSTPARSTCSTRSTRTAPTRCGRR